MNETKLHKYFFLVPGAMYAFDIWAENMKDARQKIREFLGRKTLHGIDVWKA